MRCIFLSFALSVLAADAAASRWLCSPSLTVGFKFEPSSSVWQSEFFENGPAFVISEANEADDVDPGTQFVGTRLGAAFPDIRCTSGFSAAGYLSCSGGLTHLLFNRNSLRYQTVYWVGFVSSNPKTDTTNDTPHTEIGECASF